MRIRIVEVEGTPEEIAELDIEALLQGDDQPAVEPSPSDLPAVVQQLLDEIQAWGEVLVAESPKRRTASYLRVHRQPRKGGAFLYVFPVRLLCQFRLDPGAATGCTFAKERRLKSPSPYGVALTPLTAQSLPEALRLARLAYDEVG